MYFRAYGLALLGAAAGCFSYTPPDGWLQCAPDPPECPDEYFCADDQRCYREGKVFDSQCARDPGRPSKCDDGFLLCDDFEAPTVREPWMPSNSTNPATIEVDSRRAYRGQQPLRLQAGILTGTHSRALVYQTAVIPSPDLYMRAFVYLASAPADPQILMRLENDADIGLSVYLLPNGHLRIENAIPKPAISADSIDLLPLNCWACIEWHIHTDASAGKVGLWINDTAQTPILTGNTVRTPEPQQLHVGILFKPGAEKRVYEAWIDEVVVDSKPIHCAR